MTFESVHLGCRQGGLSLFVGNRVIVFITRSHGCPRSLSVVLHTLLHFP